MTIRKTPTRTKYESKINAIIQKGGSPNNISQLKEPYRLSLRIPLPLKIQVDELILADPIQPSLTSWILEAIKQRLKRENQSENC